ncbi:protein phosphatase methylesterase [Aureobasidium sp. EXF-10728]|nr:protein phosphatase methylesterase [Aureobasidium sp. EXF-10728]
MSDLLRALPNIKNQHNAPNLRPPAMPLTTADEGNSSSSDSSASTNDSIDTLRPSESTIPTPTPNPWPAYFEQELFLESKTESQHAQYHVYLTPPKDPAKGPLFICHHGAGATGMSFGCFAAAVRRQMPGAGVCSLEAREHGSYVCSSDGQEILDFSIETLVADTLAMIDGVKQRQGWKALPPSVLVGHSLGGAVVTRIAATGSLGAQLVGFAVLDVVEGSAIEALLHMKTYLASRPSSFASVDQAINWHIRSRTIRDLESAKASVPSLLVPNDDRWVWRTDLARTQRWWEDWFTGMSGLFLKGKAAKALVLAGTDRLDKELMVGQMQGKFQLTVIPEAGHFIQEDVPEKTAHLMIEFFKRNDRSSLVLPPKVSDLLAQGKRV